jgi:hypothetical protein
MSLLIRRIAIENFRKFREKREIAGLAAGLNIVIEPNETGKSTVLEAVRAALFLKHNSKTQLITSFQPHGDEVAPEIELDFAVGAEDYALKKRFIGRAMAELSALRAQPERRGGGATATSARLRTGRGYDDDLAGALGMLWVAQSEGLSVSAPGSRVRDLIGATLEGEAGTILGSATFERVRTRIEGPFREYLTATGRPTGKYTAAQQREKAALDALAEAEQREQALEAAFAELDQARRQLATLRRDLDDGHDAAERADLEKRLETARGAAQLLAQRQAEAASAKARADSLHDLSERHAQALRRQTEAEARRDAARSERAALSENLEAARMRVTQAATGVDTARTARDAARTALAEAQARALARRRHEGVTAAHARHAQVVALEAEREALAVTAASSVPAKVLKQLEDAESEVIRHRTLLDADGTRVELIGAQGVTRDGTRLDPGEWTLTRETRIGLPGGGELVLRPSQALAGAQAALDAATARRTALLHEWSLASLADARTRNEAAREAQRQAETLEARLLAAAPADRDLGLAAGADALKVFVAANPLGVEEAADVEPRPLTELEAEDAAAEDAVARADAFDRQAIADLRDVEMAESPLAVAEQTALAALETTAEELAQLAARPDFADLAQTLAAREASAAAQVALEQACAGASLSTRTSCAARSRSSPSAARPLRTAATNLAPTSPRSKRKSKAKGARASLNTPPPRARRRMPPAPPAPASRMRPKPCAFCAIRWRRLRPRQRARSPALSPSAPRAMSGASCPAVNWRSAKILASPRSAAAGWRRPARCCPKARRSSSPSSPASPSPTCCWRKAAPCR